MGAMAGGIVMAVILVIVLPVAFLIGGAILAALLGSALKREGDLAAEGSELLTVSQTDHYSRN